MHRTGESDRLQEPARPKTGRVALWLVMGHAVVLALCFAATFTQPDHVANGQCEGIGWGCTMTPRDGTQLALIVFGLPALIVSLLICLITVGVVTSIRNRRANKQ
jgi:hypothetical protein